MIINEELKVISPFKENFDSISFYSIILDEMDFGCTTDGPFYCDNNIIYEEINKKYKIEDTKGIITIAIGKSNGVGTGGDIIYQGVNPSFSEEEVMGLSRYSTIHEIGHNFGLADLYYGWYMYDGTPSSVYSIEMSRSFYNVDSPGCKKWCSSYKPVSEYKDSISSKCLEFTNKADCISYGRKDRSCVFPDEFPECCVWSDEKFEYFETNCVPAFGSENIGIDCLNNTGCYFGAIYGNYAWRPVLSRKDTLMFGLDSNKFAEVEEKHIDKVFECCLSYDSPNENCVEFRKNYSDLLQNYNWKQRIGSCGYKM